MTSTTVDSHFHDTWNIKKIKGVFSNSYRASVGKVENDNDKIEELYERINIRLMIRQIKTNLKTRISPKSKFIYP